MNEQEQQSDTPAPEQAGLEKSTIAEQQPAPVEQHVESESESQPAPGTGYTLEMPGDIPMSAHETWQPVLDGFASAASAAGVPRSTAEQLVQGFVDADIAISTKWEANEQYYGWEDAEREMHTIYRDKAQAKIEAAQKMVRKLGLGAFMDGPGNLGNSPSVLAVLAEWHDIGKLSRADAQAELNRLMSDPRGDYFSLDNHRRVPAVLRVQLLSRIANSEPAR